MKHEECERMRDELLEYVYGCHVDPARIERALAADPELARLLEEVRRTALVLDEAARDERVRFQPRLPGSEPTFRTRGGVALRRAAAVLGVALLGPWIWYGVNEAILANARADELRLVVSAPRSVSDGAGARVHVETWDGSASTVPAEISWAAFDASGKQLWKGSERCEGARDIDLPPHIEGVRRVSVSARRGASTRQLELEFDPGASAPLVHLACDKPLYRPGERVYWRAVLLERIALEPLDSSCRMRIVDARGTPLQDWIATPETGTASGAWTIPEEAAGGEYALELRDGSDAFAVERLAFLVRAFQPPQLEKKIDLDRKTYAPGATGVAEVRVGRVGGGVPVGASVDGSLVLDGAVVWSETGRLDAQGGALFRFQVPLEVERGEARFLARVVDGGVVETEVEPFVVPTGKLAVSFYPEGGELVAGLESRVYVDVRDPLDRPIDARGHVVDAAGRTVASFATEHQGRGRFVLTAREGERYRLVIDEPLAAPVELPEAKTAGVALRAIADSAPAGAPLALRVDTLDAGPWIAAVFCRGTLVAQDPFEGAGAHDLAIALGPEVAGVLRVTVFDQELRPVAERLVHRASGRSIAVAIRPQTADCMPGDHQKLVVEARDESGQPVQAAIGLSVTDRALDALAAEPRIGLHDQAYFFADAAELEDLGDFLPAEPEAARNIDLVLGTQGWRRFAWREPAEFVARAGEPARRALLQEGHSDVPQVLDLDGGTAAGVARIASRARDALGISLGASIAVAGFLGLALLARWLGGRTAVGRHPLLYATASFALILGTGVAMLPRLLGRPSPVWLAEAMPLAAFGGEAREARLPAAEGLDLDLAAASPEKLAFLGQLAPGAPPMEFGIVDGIEPGADDRAEVRLNFLGRELMEAAEEEQAPMALLRGLAYAGDDDDLRDAKERAQRQDERIYAHVHRAADGLRTDFAETVYWNALLVTDAEGHAQVEFDLSDRVTTWVARADAHGAHRVGGGETRFEAKKPFHAEPVLPEELSSGDRIELPVALFSTRPELGSALVSIDATGPLALASQDTLRVELPDGRGRVLVPMEVRGGSGAAELSIAAEAGGFRDLARHTVRIVPRGFPHREAKSGVVRDRLTTTVVVPEDHEAGSLALSLVLYPSPLSDLLQGIEGMLQEPCGCFEQASSSNYPNVLALAYLEAAGEEAPAIAARAHDLLEKGYARLAGYECSEKGYEWFGSNPGHEALTAYGLLEFHDMASVFAVEESMLERTRAWLLDRRDGKGGFQRNERALDSFGAAPAEVTDAWITYSLALGGTPVNDIAGELDALEARAMASEDAYVVALGAGALARAGRSQAADALREKLKRMQASDGSLRGSTTSITRSGDHDLAVETTALAILAWLEDPDDLAPVERAVEWIRGERQNGGTFGATQATIQALRALTAHAQKARRIASAGTAVLSIGGKRVREIVFGEGQRGALVFDDLEGHLVAGENELVLELSGDNQFPWSLDFSYAAEQPADDPASVLALRTSLSEPRVEEGRTVSLAIELENLSEEGQPMALAVVGIPAGLEVPTEVLDDLKAGGRFDVWELRGRELVLYWRALEPRAHEEVHLDLLARLPGHTSGPASRAYLYYTPESKRWCAPLDIEIPVTR